MAKLRIPTLWDTVQSSTTQQPFHCSTDSKIPEPSKTDESPSIQHPSLQNLLPALQQAHGPPQDSDSSHYPSSILPDELSADNISNAAKFFRIRPNFQVADFIPLNKIYKAL
jgi:hypothetical protein